MIINIAKHLKIPELPLSLYSLSLPFSIHDFVLFDSLYLKEIVVDGDGRVFAQKKRY